MLADAETLQMKSLIPEAALDKHIAFLGATGSGKTSAAKSGVIEPALAAGERAVIIDPTGAWWGLRVGKDGKAKGYPIYIFGGDHGDYPLRARDADALAEAFGSSTDSAIFDTSLMTVSERTSFFTNFAESLRRKNKGPLKVVIDEAHLFMPQAGAKSGGAVPDMLHAGNNLVSLGRSRGLRITLISQRPAKLHKDSLTQVQSLVAMRLMAPQDRKAVSDWISDQADPETGKQIIASLPSLKPGEAWVWSPLDNYLDRVHFPLPKTFDSSRAPDRTDGAGPSLTPINLDALKDKLATVEAETKANDPRALRARIAELERAAKTSKPVEKIIATPSPISDKDRERAFQAGERQGYETGYARGWQDGDRAGFSSGVAAAHSVVKAALPDIASITYAPGTAPKRIPALAQAALASGALPPHQRASTHAPAPVQRAAGARTATSGSGASLPPGERAVLIAAVQYDGVDRDQLSVLTGYKRSSRDAYIQRLREKGLIAVDGQTIVPTADASDALGADYQPLPTGAELQAYWARRLPEGEGKILSALIAVYPDAVARNDLDDATGYKRSSRDAYIQRLKARGLVTTSGSTVTAAETLF